MQRTVEEMVTVPRKVWTREEAHALVDVGFPNAEKLELIEGEMINRMGKKCASSLAELDGRMAADDLLVTKRSIRDYNSIPTPDDLRLVIEVSDTTLQFDLTVKAHLYARAGSVEYWVVDVRDKRLVVHRHSRLHAANEEVAPLAAPTLECVWINCKKIS